MTLADWNVFKCYVIFISHATCRSRPPSIAHLLLSTILITLAITLPRESMMLMGELTSSILTTRQGVFQIAGEEKNFNIIGTYGRALRRNGDLISNYDKTGQTVRALQYAIAALESAKEKSDL